MGWQTFYAEMMQEEEQEGKMQMRPGAVDGDKGLCREKMVVLCPVNRLNRIKL